MKIKGKVWRFGDDVNTDEIIPAKFLNTTDPTELGKECMSGIREGFAKAVEKGDIIVAGKNFGCGSSREHAPVSIKGAGISCVIAETFARIFFRNAINIGLPIIENSDVARETKEGDVVEIDFGAGRLKNLTSEKEYKIASFPEFMQQLIDNGGLMNWVAKNIK